MSFIHMQLQYRLQYIPHNKEKEMQALIVHI